MLQSSMQMSETQKANMMEARELYIKKMGELLLERQALRVKLQVLYFAPLCIAFLPSLTSPVLPRSKLLA